MKRRGGTDDALLELAEKNRGVLCTNDKELKKRAFDKRITVMFMRKKKILEIAGGFDV
jgi:rRNA-processing protein FCF1